MNDPQDKFKQEYTQSQIQAYYDAWSKAQPGTHERTAAWNLYVDARDGKRQGHSHGTQLLAKASAH